MPTSAPGSNGGARAAAVLATRRSPERGASARRGFTLIELVIVIAIIAISAGVISLALRDGDEARLEEEAARLVALLEMARAEARVAGSPVRWVPSNDGPDPSVQFRFVGLTAAQPLPTRWLDSATRAQVVGGTSVVLGPEAILPPQRIVLRLADQRLELATDGLGPFAVAAAPAAATAAAQ